MRHICKLLQPTVGHPPWLDLKYTASLLRCTVDFESNIFRQEIRRWQGSRQILCFVLLRCSLVTPEPLVRGGGIGKLVMRLAVYLCRTRPQSGPPPRNNKMAKANVRSSDLSISCIMVTIEDNKPSPPFWPEFMQGILLTKHCSRACYTFLKAPANKQHMP